MAYAVLALVEGNDPELAAMRARKYERAWSVRHAPLYSNVDVTQDGRLFFTSDRNDI